MYCNIKVLIWRITGDDEYYYKGLEWNLLQLENVLWNVIGVDESYWYRKELNVFQCEGFNMEPDGLL